MYFLWTIVCHIFNHRCKTASAWLLHWYWLVYCAPWSSRGSTSCEATDKTDSRFSLLIILTAVFPHHIVYALGCARENFIFSHFRSPAWFVVEKRRKLQWKHVRIWWARETLRARKWTTRKTEYPSISAFTILSHFFHLLLRLYRVYATLRFAAGNYFHFISQRCRILFIKVFWGIFVWIFVDFFLYSINKRLIVDEVFGAL